jgi:hypothetical protein
MATDNKGVMVYITPELETVLEKYCIERNITRKTRDGHVFASLGTGIVQYLKSQLLGIESNSGIALGAALTKDDVLELIRENNTSTSPNIELVDIQKLIADAQKDFIGTDQLAKYADREEVNQLIATANNEVLELIANPKPLAIAR